MTSESVPFAGATIGHYRIVSPLGAGGMGEVYLAHDTTLDRPVALKVLPAEVARDRERMGRFIQEAKAASALSHPNVAHVYEIGEHEGLWFIAMEYVEGRTVEQLLRERRVSSAEICDVGFQVADALQAAHAKGIVHRDIKPGNIMVTTRGQAKVLDFGIAKIIPRSSSSEGDDRLTSPQTATGVVLGTGPYMSPEQALGRPVDQRSDLFSLGVVLYQMATGSPPFSGRTPGENFDRLLHAEPDPVTHSNAAIPGELERAILKCLRKAPEERYQSAADLQADLAVLKRRTTGGASVSLADSEYYLPRTAARWLFLAAQALYVGMYLAALRWSDQMADEFGTLFGAAVVEPILYCAVITALVGMAVRLYFASLVAFDHVRTGVQFRRTFPAVLALDALWAAAPLSLAQHWGPVLVLACIPPLVFLPFSQRTLIRSAYDLKQPRRTSTGRRPRWTES